MRSFENFVDWDRPKTGKIDIIRKSMKIDTKIQTFDFFDIKNRYFMYSPETGLLILHTEYRYSDDPDNIATSLGDWSDHYPIRGYVGNGKNCRNGIIHFAPPIYKDEYNSPKGGIKEAIECVEMFIKKGGASEDIVLKNFLPNTDFSKPTSEKDIEAPWRQIKKNRIAYRFDL